MTDTFSSTDDFTGKLLERKYRIERKVGEGGFGVVYEAFHMTLATPVAIKVLRYPDDASATSRASHLEKFLAEAQLLPRLKHPGIVAALDVGTVNVDGEDTPRAYIVLEWCGSQNLQKDLRARRGLGGRSVDEAWAIARPVVEAIAYAHERGFVHRDIKPANIMLVQDKGAVSPRVIDFGIAKVAPGEPAGAGDTFTHSATRAFSLPYAAPEQLAGARTGPWTDVHALALLLVELLTDEPPYGGDEVALAAIDPRRPSAASRGVGIGPWERVLSRALSLKPSERYDDAGALLVALADTRAEAAAAFSRSVSERTPIAAPASDPLSRERTILTGTSRSKRRSTPTPRRNDASATTTSGTSAPRGLTPIPEIADLTRTARAPKRSWTIVGVAAAAVAGAAVIAVAVGSGMKVPAARSTGTDPTSETSAAPDASLAPVVATESPVPIASAETSSGPSTGTSTSTSTGRARPITSAAASATPRTSASAGPKKETLY